MSAPRDDGGPAFPVMEPLEQYRDDQYVTVHLPVGGMSLRDYFAGQALAECIHLASTIQRYGEHKTLPWTAPAAEAAYEVADAMLKARR